MLKETASVASPLISDSRVWVLSIEGTGALNCLRNETKGSVINVRFGISLMYLLASFINKGMKITKKTRISVIAMRNVTNTLIPFGTPIFIRYTCRGLNKKAKTMLKRIGDAKLPSTHKVMNAKNNTVIRKTNC